MLRVELRKCMHPILFVAMLICTIYYVYLSIQPGIEYFYGQPLSEGEFIYAGLKDDYVSGTIETYQGEALVNVRIVLSEKEKQKILSILKKMNKNFNVDEKMSDVHLDLTDSQCINLMKEFEKEIGYKTDYYYYLDTVNYPVYMYKRFDYNSKNKSGFHSITNEKQEFKKVLLNGISAAYARCAAEPLGVIVGVIAVFFSSAIFSRDRKNKVNSYLYTSDISSVSLILYRMLSVFLPLVIISFFAGVCCCYFFYKQNLYWGFDLHYIEFFKYILFWTVPTILIAVTSSIFLDLLFENTTVSFGLQFIIWFISITKMFGENNLCSPIISSDYFGHIALYETSKITVFWNRFLMILVSVFCFCGSVFLFERRREGKESLKKKVLAFLSPINAQRKKGEIVGDYKEKSRSIWYYSWRRVFSWNILLCISYTILILLVIFLFIGINMTATAKDVASFGENIIIFVSAFLFFPISNVESRHQVHEAVYLCKISYCRICLHRILLAVIGTVIFSGIPVMIVSVWFGVKIGIWCAGVCLSSVYLGFVGMLFAEVTGKNSIGYFAYIVYYMLCVTNKMKCFSVMGYTFGMKYSKYSLLFGIVLFSILVYFIMYAKQKGRH